MEIENINKFEVEGKTLDALLDMADSGKINEAEINYSKEEVLDGMKNLVREAGYPDITNMESL